MEYTAIRNAASVYDLCPMVKYRISGPDAAAYLNRLTVRNAAKLSVGGVHYTSGATTRARSSTTARCSGWAQSEYPHLLPGTAPALAAGQRLRL